MQRKWDITDRDTLKMCIDEVITRIEDIGDLEVGVIAAQEIIDIVTAHAGPEFYNRGVQDARKILQERFADIQVDIDLLEQK